MAYVSFSVQLTLLKGQK